MFKRITDRASAHIVAVALVFTSVSLFHTCSDKGTSIQPPPPFPCDDAKLVLSRFTTLAIPPPPEIGGDSITCPYFIYGPRPFQFGDTLAVILSQPFGAQLFGSNQVYVNIKSGFGDNETYCLNSGFWPCETRAVDIEIYRTLIPYAVPLRGQSYPFPNNGQLEVRPSGDTIIASFVSYCTNKHLADSAAILPR
jgi:hypothetical protein